MENEAGKDRSGNHEGPGAKPSGLDLLFYAKENLPFRKSLPHSPRPSFFLIFNTYR